MNPSVFYVNPKSGFLAFGRVVRSVQTHYREIINFFDRRSTNAASESFNAKIKEFRTQFRGVKDRTFFLFRLAKISASAMNPSGFYVDPKYTVEQSISKSV